MLSQTRPDQTIHPTQHMRDFVDEKLLKCTGHHSQRHCTCNKGKLLFSAHVAGRSGSVPLILRDTRDLNTAANVAFQ